MRPPRIEAGSLRHVASGPRRYVFRRFPRREPVLQVAGPGPEIELRLAEALER
jgi:hypothetical protein